MTFDFDRYVGGRLKAEGASIKHAASWSEAKKKARELFAAGARRGEMERTVFVPHKPDMGTKDD